VSESLDGKHDFLTNYSSIVIQKGFVCVEFRTKNAVPRTLDANRYNKLSLNG
jgi:UV DNA damage repair endonuclease